MGAKWVSDQNFCYKVSNRSFAQCLNMPITSGLKRLRLNYQPIVGQPAEINPIRNKTTVFFFFRRLPSRFQILL